MRLVRYILLLLLVVSSVQAQNLIWEMNEGRGPFDPVDENPSAPTIREIVDNTHGGAGAFAYADIPFLFAPDWVRAPTDANGNLDFGQASGVVGELTELDFTYFRTTVEIDDPSAPFILTYNAVDDGAIVYVYNDIYRDGIQDPNGGASLFSTPFSTDLSPILATGNNIILIVQFDDAFRFNYLNVSVFYEGGVEETCPEYTIIEEGTSASCPGTNDAAFFISASCDLCNSSEFEYSLDGGQNFQMSGFFRDLSSGLYDVTVRNTTFPECDSTFNVFLEAAPDTESPVITECPESVAVQLGINGVGFINEAALLDDFEAEDNCSENLQVSISQTTIDLSVEQIIITVTDEAGNSAECPVDIEIALPCNLFITGIDATLGDCPSLSETVIVSTNNSGMELEYSLDDQFYQSSNIFEGVEPGFYFVFVREVNNINCVTVGSITVQQGADQTAPIINCPTDTLQIELAEGTFVPTQGNLSIESSDNCSRVNLAFSPSEVSTPGLTEIIVTANDASGNTNSCTVFVNIPVVEVPCNLIALSTAVVQDLDCPDGFATLNIQAIGAATNLEYSLNGIDFQEENRFDDVPVGEYNIIVREIDDFDCSITNLIRVEEAAIDTIAPQITCPTITSSFNLVAGTVFVPSPDVLMVSATDDCTDPSEISYRFEPDNLVGVGTTELLIFAIDRSGNEDSCSVLVNLTSDELDCTLEDFSFIVIPGSCPGDNGTIEVVTGGLDVPLEYSLDGIIYQTDSIFTNVRIGVYNVIVRELGIEGCSESERVEMIDREDNQPPQLFCPDNIVPLQLDDTGVIELTATLLDVFATDNCTNSPIINITPPQLTTVGETTVIVDAVDDTGLSISCMIIINVLDVQACNLDELTVISTEGDCPAEGTAQMLAFGSEETLEYSIDGINFQLSGRFEELVSGNYTAYVRELANPSCSLERIFTIEEVIDVNPPIFIQCPISDTIPIIVETFPASAAALLIDIVDAVDDCGIQFYTFAPTEITEYGLLNVSVTATDASGNESAECNVLINILDGNNLKTDEEFDSFHTVQNTENKFRIHPNPVSERAVLQLDIAEEGQLEISVHDMSGNVFQETTHAHISAGRTDFTVDVSEFPQGIYFVTIKTPHTYQTQRMVVTK